jgi:membrane-associated phospholipid phosphatase
VELTAIMVTLLIVVGVAVVVAGTAMHAWADRHRDTVQSAISWVGELRWLRVPDGSPDPQPAGGRRPGVNALAVTLILGLAAVTLAGTGLGALVDNVTDGDGVVFVDHPVAAFVAARRAAALTSVMRAVSAVGGPAGMVVLAVAAGVLLAVRSRSWHPVAVLAVTAGGAVVLTLVFKAALARSRPPLAQAIAAADGYGFPSAHAAVAAAVCGAVAWLCSLQVRSWRARVAIWAVAAMLATLVGVSRVYLAVHWTTDVAGGWIFGALWLAVVITCWAAFGRARVPRRAQAATSRPARRRPRRDWR